ncbi:hypothetical protein D9M68_826160 [compost metagenome]
MPSDCGSTTAAMAMNTAARPIMLCMKATSSGILVISTLLAMKAPRPPPTTTAASTQAMPVVKSTLRARACPWTSAMVVSTAIAMPVMPKMLPRIEVVGWDRPFRAWMKQTLATRYSSVTRFMLTWRLPLQPWGRPSCLSS